MKPESERQTSRLPAKVIASYTFNSFASNCMWMLNNYFLLFFYTDVIQLPAKAAAVILLVARVWDAVNDPMMGILCDRTRSREGKSRFWLGRMAIPAGLFVALSYSCPGWATPARVIWAAVFYILQGMAQTAIGIPTSSLIITMTPDRTERVRLAQFTAVPSALANFLIPAFTMRFVRSFGEGYMRRGFFVLATIIGVMYAIGTTMIYITTKGLDPDTSRQSEKAEVEKEPGAIDLLRAAVQNRYCILVTGSYMVYLLLSGLMGSSMIYYFRYYVGNEDLMGVYSSAAVVGMFLAIAMMRAISKKIGNARTCMFGAAVCIISVVPRIITRDRIMPVFVFCMLFIGIGGGLISEMIHQCKMDAATYGKLHGTDNPGVVVSLFTFAQKFGQAISSAIAAALLAAFHYKGGETPSPAALNLFFAENIILPLIIVITFILIMLPVAKLEKEMAEELKQKEIQP